MMHSELKIIKAGADTALLFIHGILGTPRHFDFLLPLAPESWSAWELLLPGHGGSCRDFGESSMYEWKACCEAALAELAESHSRIILVGHSMGTLLSVYLADKHPDRVNKIFALAMPLYCHYTPVAMAGSFHTAFCSARSDNKYYRSCREACSIALSKNPFAYLPWIPRYLELFALASNVRNIMRSLKVPCLALQSRKDELAAFRSVKAMGRARYIVLPDSRHYLYSDKDRERIRREFIKFISE